MSCPPALAGGQLIFLSQNVKKLFVATFLHIKNF